MEPAKRKSGGRVGVIWCVVKPLLMRSSLFWGMVKPLLNRRSPVMCPLVCWCMGPLLRWVEISGSILKILKGIINLGMPEKITKFFSFNWNISSYRNVIKVETVSGLSLVCLSGKMFWAAWHWCTRGGNCGNTWLQLHPGYEKGHITKLM